MKERLAYVKIKTPITDEHWKRIFFAVQAVCEIQILDDYVEVWNIPTECREGRRICEITCEGCDHFKDRRKVK